MSGGGGVILNGGIAAAVSAVLVAWIQTRSFKKSPPPEPVEPQADPAVALRRQLLEFADQVDAEADRCTDTKSAARLTVAARIARSRIFDQ